MIWTLLRFFILKIFRKLSGWRDQPLQKNNVDRFCWNLLSIHKIEIENHFVRVFTFNKTLVFWKNSQFVTPHIHLPLNSKEQKSITVYAREERQRKFRNRWNILNILMLHVFRISFFFSFMICQFFSLPQIYLEITHFSRPPPKKKKKMGL